jgi:hypothetical protein
MSPGEGLLPPSQSRGRHISPLRSPDAPSSGGQVIPALARCSPDTGVLPPRFVVFHLGDAIWRSRTCGGGSISHLQGGRGPPSREVHGH